LPRRDRIMRRRGILGGVVLAVALGTAARRADAQGPTIDTGAPPGPGANASGLGATPGANEPTLGSVPGAGGDTGGDQGELILGGRPGPSVPRVPTTIPRPGTGAFGILEAGGIAAPAPLPTPEVPLFGTLVEPDRPEDLGPEGG